MPYEIFTIVGDKGTAKVALYPVFFVENGTCCLEWLFIRPTGVVSLARDDYDLDELRDMVERGVVFTEIRDGQDVYIRELVTVTVENARPIIENGEFLKEVVDIIQELNGQPTTSDHCRAAYRIFAQDPSEPNRLRLKKAYERVPRHLHCWLLSFDEKDAPIRQALAGFKPRPAD